MILTARTHPGVWAALAHRVSGLMLALFLPFHFLALGLAIEFLSGPGHLNQMIGAGAGAALLVGVIFLVNVA